MADSPKQMKPIWYFVGLVLLVMGIIIFLSGIYYLFVPVQSGTVLYELRPSIWWGGFMAVSGIIFLVIGKKTVVE